MKMLPFIMLSVFAASCGADELVLRSLSVQGSFGGEVRPPVGYYSALLAERFESSSRINTQAVPRGKIFLNFAGGEVFKGFSSKESFLPCHERVHIASSSLTMQEQEGVYDELANFFDTEHVQLDLVIDEPLEGNYSTVHVGGWYDALGCRGQAVLGSAPSDHGNVNPADTGFVFSAEYREQNLVTRAVAHVIGRMIGLPVQNQQESLMGRNITAATPLRFNESARRVLKNQHNFIYDHRDRGGDLPGQLFVNTVGRVLTEIKDSDALDVTPLESQLRGIVPADIKLPGLGRALAALSALGLDKHGFQKNNKWENKIKDVLTAVLKQSAAKSVKKPREVRDNVTSSISDVLGDAFGDGNSKRSTSLLTALPDVAALLELDHLSSSAQLFPLLNTHQQLIAKEFSGRDHESMQSLLKVGYFQRLHELH